MRILGIDPGPKESAYVLWDGCVIGSELVPNEILLHALKERTFKYDLVGIEMINAMGMAVGREVFETCVMIGRFYESCHSPVRLPERTKIKLHLCGSARAKDPNVRRALLDRLGPVGTKNNPGPCYGVAGHMWQALGVVIYTLDHEGKNRNQTYE